MRLLFYGFVFLYLLNFSYAKECQTVRTAFDIGSTTTKMVVAEIDKCKLKIIKIHLEKIKNIDFKRDLKLSKDGSFSKEILAEAIQKISSLKNMALKKGSDSFVAIPSTYFKKVKDHKVFLKKIKEKTEMKIFFIKKRISAILNFLAATNSLTFDKQKLLVWDIGGSNMNITKFDGTNYHVYTDRMGSSNFRNMVLEGILGKDHLKIISPNPLKKKNSQKAIRMAKIYAKFQTPPPFKEWGRNSSLTLGTGGVHNLGIIQKIYDDKKNYTIVNIKKAIEKYQFLKDQQIGGKFADTQVTNLILIHGFMEVLGIKKVSSKGTNTAHGALIYQEFWK